MIDWSKPIEGHPAPVPLYGPRPRFAGRGRSLGGIREEQLRRAAILIKATKGEPLTKRNASHRVRALARAIPGMAYRTGAVVHFSLAPMTSMWGDPLPGRDMGRPSEWPADRLDWLRSEVDRIKSGRSAGMTDVDALRQLKKEWPKDRGFSPALKTLRNKLSEAKTSR